MPLSTPTNPPCQSPNFLNNILSYKCNGSPITITHTSFMWMLFQKHPTSSTYLSKNNSFIFIPPYIIVKHHLHICTFIKLEQNESSPLARINSSHLSATNYDQSTSSKSTILESSSLKPPCSLTKSQPHLLLHPNILHLVPGRLLTKTLSCSFLL